MFRKHFPLPWTAIWPMTKNSSGTWQERNTRDEMSAPCNLLHWLDLSFWSSLYFISSPPPPGILISCWPLTTPARCPGTHFLLASSQTLSHATIFTGPAQCPSEMFLLCLTMPITTKQDIFNETRFIFVTDITTSHLLQQECQPQLLSVWEWSPLTDRPPHVTPILGRDGLDTWEGCHESVWEVVPHIIMACMMSCWSSSQATRHYLSTPISLSLAKSDWRVLFSSRHLHLNLQNIRTINGFEGRLAIIVVWQQNIFSLFNGCFCGYWCVFSGMIGSSWTENWERAADGVPCVPHHYPIIVTKLPCKFP